MNIRFMGNIIYGALVLCIGMLSMDVAAVSPSTVSLPSGGRLHLYPANGFVDIVVKAPADTLDIEKGKGTTGKKKKHDKQKEKNTAKDPENVWKNAAWGDEIPVWQSVGKPHGKRNVTVMMCPGGGYDHLAIGHEGFDMAEWFNSLGVDYAVLEYRLPQEPCDTLPMTDAHEALEYLSSCNGLNPDAIGIMGASAGGHLASYIANNDSRVAFQILLYPVVSMEDDICHGGSRKNLLGENLSQETKDRFSCDKLVTGTTPPAFIVLSGDDKDVDPANSIRYYEALSRNGVPAELHIYPDGGHGWGFRDSFRHKREWIDNLAEWLIYERD